MDVSIVGAHKFRQRLGDDSSAAFLAEDENGKQVFGKKLIVKDIDKFRTEFKSISDKT